MTLNDRKVHELDPTEFYLKISDFGLSTFFDGKTEGGTKAMGGSLHYMAPEILRGEAVAGPPLDIYSMGIIFFALILGRLPFSAYGDTIKKRRPTTREEREVIRQRIMAGAFDFEAHGRGGRGRVEETRAKNNNINSNAKERIITIGARRRPRYRTESSSKARKESDRSRQRIIPRSSSSGNSSRERTKSSGTAAVAAAAALDTDVSTTIHELQGTQYAGSGSTRSAQDHGLPSPSLRNLLSKMLAIHVPHRCTLHEIFGHPWLQDQSTALETPVDDNGGGFTEEKKNISTSVLPVISRKKTSSSQGPINKRNKARDSNYTSPHYKSKKSEQYRVEGMERKNQLQRATTSGIPSSQKRWPQQQHSDTTSKAQLRVKIVKDALFPSSPSSAVSPRNLSSSSIQNPHRHRRVVPISPATVKKGNRKKCVASPSIYSSSTFPSSSLVSPEESHQTAATSTVKGVARSTFTTPENEIVVERGKGQRGGENEAISSREAQLKRLLKLKKKREEAERRRNRAIELNESITKRNVAAFAIQDFFRKSRKGRDVECV